MGALGDDENGSLAGAAYVFQRVGDFWVGTHKLVASDGTAEDSFGFSVAVGADVAVVGAVQTADQGSHSGAAYVFRRSSGTWIEETKLLASDGAPFDFMGFSVATDGELVVSGAYKDDDRGPDSGSAHAYQLGGADCNENGVPDACDIADGTSLDVNGNGIPDECEMGGDVTGDAEVDEDDLETVVGNWGLCSDPPCYGDTDQNGEVNIVDLATIILNWTLTG